MREHWNTAILTERKQRRRNTCRISSQLAFHTRNVCSADMRYGENGCVVDYIIIYLVQQPTYDKKALFFKLLHCSSTCSCGGTINLLLRRKRSLQVAGNKRKEGERGSGEKGRKEEEAEEVQEYREYVCILWRQ